MPDSNDIIAALAAGGTGQDQPGPPADPQIDPKVMQNMLAGAINSPVPTSAAARPDMSPGIAPGTTNPAAMTSLMSGMSPPAPMVQGGRPAVATNPNAPPTMAGRRPNIVNLISGLINPARGTPAGERVPSRTDVFENFLGNFLNSFSQGLQAAGHGPGANLRGLAGGIQAPYRTDVEQFQQRQAAQAQQAAIQSEQAKTAQTEAQTKMIQGSSQITLPNGQTMLVPNAYLKNVLGPMITGSTKEDIAKIQDKTKLKIAGYGDDGKPLPLDQLSLPAQTRIDLQNQQKKLQSARLAAMNADLTTPAGRVAYQRLMDAHTTAQAAATRASAMASSAGTNMNRYLADYFGVDPSGRALPGVDKDNPMGMKLIEAFKPSGAQRTRADLAVMVQNSNEKMKEIINRHADMFGPGAGQITSLEDMIGSLGSDAAEFETYLGSSAAANAGVHQFRSYNAAQHFEHILAGGSGRFGRNVNALVAGLDADTDAVQPMLKAGKLPGQPQPGGAQTAAPKKGDPVNSLVDKYKNSPKPN